MRTKYSCLGKSIYIEKRKGVINMTFLQKLKETIETLRKNIKEKGLC